LTPEQGADSPFFKYFFIFLNFIFLKFGEWAKAFGRMGVQHPHFLKLAPTLGSVKSCKLHGDWRFHFFSKLIFSDLERFFEKNTLGPLGVNQTKKYEPIIFLPEACFMQYSCS
jgi:hypothetical protein